MVATVVQRFDVKQNRRLVDAMVLAGKPRSKEFLTAVENMYTERGFDSKTHMLYLPRENHEKILRDVLDEPVDNKQFLRLPSFLHRGYDSELNENVSLPYESNGVQWAIHCMVTSALTTVDI